MSRKLKVLIVDDDAMVLRIARGALESRGHEVVARSAALGTTATMVREKPDVILLDIEMPGLRGDSLAEVLQDQGERMGHAVPIILYSGASATELSELSQAPGVVGAIRKNEDVGSFLAAFDDLTREF